MISILENILRQSSFEYDSIEEQLLDDGILRFNVLTQKPQILVGRHGDTLFALQHLYRLVLRKDAQDVQEILLDVNDYRKKQEEIVIGLADNKVKQLQQNGGVVYFAPMPSYKRRAIHLHIMKNYPEIVTESVGEGLGRRLTITLKTN